MSFRAKKKNRPRVYLALFHVARSPTYSAVLVFSVSMMASSRYYDSAISTNICATEVRLVSVGMESTEQAKRVSVHKHETNCSIAMEDV